MSSPGLRERKKQRTRWAIQEHALRLFAQQGYDATTVEQIAAAAEISPSTFFRYFRTKEDVVIEDQYDPMLVAAIAGAPPELPLLPALRHAMRGAFAQIGAQEQATLEERTKLVMSVPALRARVLENLAATIDIMAEPLATRADRDPTDFTVRAFAGACIGAWFAAITEWAGSDGTKNLADLMDAALGAIETGL